MTEQPSGAFGEERRRTMKRLVGGGAAVWVAPTVFSPASAAAASPPPVTPGRRFARVRTEAGSFTFCDSPLTDTFCLATSADQFDACSFIQHSTTTDEITIVLAAGATVVEASARCGIAASPTCTPVSPTANLDGTTTIVYPFDGCPFPEFSALLVFDA